MLSLSKCLCWTPPFAYRLLKNNLFPLKGQKTIIHEECFNLSAKMIWRWGQSGHFKMYVFVVYPFGIRTDMHSWDLGRADQAFNSDAKHTH